MFCCVFISFYVSISLNSREQQQKRQNNLVNCIDFKWFLLEIIYFEVKQKLKVEQMICLVELNMTLKTAGLQTLPFKFDLCFGQL